MDIKLRPYIYSPEKILTSCVYNYYGSMEKPNKNKRPMG